MEAQKVKFDVIYNGYSIKKTKEVEAKFIATSNLNDVLPILSLVGKPVSVGYSINGGENKYKLGSFSIDKITIDKDLELALTLKAPIEYTRLDSVAPILEEEAIITLYFLEEEYK